MNESPYLITKIEGYTPEISRLVCMMNYARNVTLDSVKNLTTQQLDFLLDEKSNSIGALLMHIASVDYFYNMYTFEQRDLNENEWNKWGTALDLGKQAQDTIKGNPLSYYVDLLNETRKDTLEKFRNVDDKWLYTERPLWGNEPANNYFMWFHVFEDEINHRGQVNFIRKRISTNPNQKPH